MKNFVLITIVLGLAKVKCQNFNSLSVDTPDVIIDNIIDAKMCTRQIGANNLPNLQNIEREGLLPENNEHLNVYYGCMYKRKGIIDEEGTVNVANLRLYLKNLFTMNQAITSAQKKLVDDCIDHCKDTRGKDYGDKSVKLQNCVMNKLYELVKE